MLAGVAALASGAAPSFASYGDSANVFGKITNKSGALGWSWAAFGGRGGVSSMKLKQQNRGQRV